MIIELKHSGPSTGFFDQRYLKLDTSNNPLTGTLQIEPGIPDFDAPFREMIGLEMIIGNTQINDYGVSLKWMSADSSLTTETPKLVAHIITQATESILNDLDGGTDLVFGVTPKNPGATNVPIESFRIRGEGGFKATGGSEIIGNADEILLTLCANATQTNNIVRWEDSGGGFLGRINGDGGLHLGPATANQFKASFSDITTVLPTTDSGGVKVNWTANLGASDYSKVGYGLQFAAGTHADHSGAMSGTMHGIKGVTNHFGTGLADDMRGATLQTSNKSTGVITDASSGYFQTVTNDGAGSITNAYGVFVEDQNEAATLNYAIFTNAGEVRLGDTLRTAGDRIKSTETSTGTATVSDTVEVHFCNSATDYVLTLPAQSDGKQVRIINKNTGVVTLTPVSGTIGGETTQLLYQDEVFVATSDNTNWW